MLTYANQLTLLRMLFVPCFVLLLIYGHPKAATVLFLLAAVTDGLDGLIARKLQQRTVLGSFLDPMADKILLTAAFVTLTIPSLAVSVLIIHLQTHHSQFPPSFLGKCTTALQLLTVGVCMLANFYADIALAIFPFITYTTLVFTFASGLHYAYKSIKIIASYQEAEDVSSRN